MIRSWLRFTRLTWAAFSSGLAGGAGLRDGTRERGRRRERLETHGGGPGRRREWKKTRGSGRRGCRLGFRDREGIEENSQHSPKQSGAARAVSLRPSFSPLGPQSRRPGRGSAATLLDKAAAAGGRLARWSFRARGKALGSLRMGGLGRRHG